jgi:membrane-bound lytic murein transglycosylase B
MLHTVLLAALLAASPSPKHAPAKPKHAPAHASAKSEHPGAKAFARELAKEAHATHPELSAQAIGSTLARARYQQGIIDAITKPAEAKPWKDYRPLFLGQKRIDEGIAFYRAERDTLEALGAKYGVPPEVIVAIVGVETFYGRNVGKYKALDALATLAFHYPPREAFFRSELKQLFLLRGPGFPYQLDELVGSYAGAMGMGQFMPSSIAKYAIDGDGDGRIDLWRSRPDVLASVANYLAGYGWERGAPIAEPAVLPDGMDVAPLETQGLEPKSSVGALFALGITSERERPPELPASVLGLDGESGREHWLTYRNFYVLSRYNRSPLYCMAVHQLAGAIAAGVAAEPKPAAAPAAP